MYFQWKETCILRNLTKNLTAFATHKRIYRYTRLIFGINNASEISQRAIEDTLAGCEAQFNILNDIFVYGKDQAKVQTINDARTIRTATEVRSFLGLGNYCGRFIKDYSTLTAPLRRLTKKNVPFNWGKRDQGAFKSLKASHNSDEVMTYYITLRQKLLL